VSTVDTHARRMLWFVTLSQQEQREAIQRLSRDGMSDHDIAAATKLSTEQVCQILGQPPQCEGCGE
jgi:hypothetical protein